MRKIIALTAALAAIGVLGFAAGALAEDDYGPGYGSTTIGEGTTTTGEGATTSSGYGPVATTSSFKVALDALQEVPKPTAPAKAAGTFSATLKSSGSGGTIGWTLTFRGLSGKAVAAHIHKGAKGKAGGVVVPLCGPCTAGKRGSATITPAVASMLKRGQAYVNVHTAKNQAGEIRGQIRLAGST